MTFEGFGEEITDFYLGLGADNSKAYWQAHKATFDAAVAAPLKALADELEPRFGEAKVFRPYRDVRFSTDKSPYKVQASFAISSDAGGLLYFQVDHHEVLLAGGFYEPSRDQLERWRALQDEPTVTAELDAVVARLAAAGCPLGSGDPLKTAPRGYAKDHPRIAMLRRRRLEAAATHPIEPWLFGRECLDVVRREFAVLDEWNTWLSARVGPSEEALGRAAT